MRGQGESDSNAGHQPATGKPPYPHGRGGKQFGKKKVK